MLDRLRQIAIFAKTVEHGSFRAAAKALGVSPSVVSHHISDLEQQLGTALLYRSTRKLALTGDGETLLVAARAMLESAEAGIEAVTDAKSDPSGELRLTVPAVLAQSRLVDLIAEFATAHTKVQLLVDFSDLRRDLLDGGFDVAIRMGWLRDSSLKARKLGELTRQLVAAGSYLDARPAPLAPQDLVDWDWIEFLQVPQRPTFRRDGAGPVRIKPRAQIRVNDANALYRLACAGSGLAILPTSLTDAGIASGLIRPVLPDWHVASVGIFAVWPPNAPRDGLTAHFVRFLALSNVRLFGSE